ncbi:MAG: photosynthetic reaction center cytochrome c subunit [Pyrinomonadaceae bacterium]|nr:photosynthetic reaction center cytochrome c subunit [Pyrinomonadaceae bacterium]
MTLKNILRGLCLAAAFACASLPLSNWTRRAVAGTQQAQGDKPVEQTRKNIQVLKGLPESQLFPVMNLVAVSLGVKCDFCHVKQKDPKGGADVWVWESDEKEHKRIGRQMMRMTLDINKNNLDALGGYGVTCYTCHRGTTGGPRVPPLPVTVSGHEDHPAAPSATPSAAPAAARPARPTPEQILQRYVEALGGRAAVAKIQTLVMKGTREASQNRNWPIEVALKGADKFSLVASVPQQGTIMQALNGAQGGWISNQRGVREATADELTAFRNTALLYAPVKIREPFPALDFNGRTKIGERDAWVLRATAADGVITRYAFDAETGLLLRQTTLTPTVLVPVPQQIDYEDYRDVGGVKLPFTIRISEIDTFFSSTRKFTEIKPNVPVEDVQFHMPPPPPKVMPKPSPKPKS